VVCSAAVVGLVLAASVAPFLLSRGDPLTMNAAAAFAGPSAAHPLGADQFGRDILTRLIYGARPSAEVATGSVALAALAGVPAGIVAGYFSGIAELLTMRGTDVILCFPPILVAMLVVGFLGAGVAHLVFIIGFLSIPLFARLAFAETLSVRRREFVEAGRAVGASPARILYRGVLPNIAGPLVIQASLGIASALLLESGLSFLGLGVLPPAPSWGLMIADARRYMLQAPGYVLWPSLALALTVLAVNVLGDALQDYLNPALRR
jgi:peptide/nickel transport system permease protein